ncbi:MAG: SGNH/GDSL hydrolase family protein [Candidatus Eisenbacteria bacterium]
MKKHLRLTPVLLLAAFVAGCQGPCEKIGSITGPALTSGTADFTTYVAAGTSISAGYQSGGIVDRHQTNSFPAIFARQVGKTVLQNGQGDFTFPSMGHDGFPQLLAIQSFSPLIISNSGRTLGYPAANYMQATSYQNMGVPGAIAFDFADTTRYHATADPNMFSVVARYRGTVAAQVLGQAPTFISYEFGANEVLGNATTGGFTPIFPSANYAALLTGHMNAIHGTLPNAKLAIFTVPDVASIPFCTTFKPYTVMLSTGAVTPLLVKPTSGSTPENLSPNDLVLLTAKDSLAIGTGFPVGAYNYLNPAAPGNGRGLARTQVLDATEQTAIRNETAKMNLAVDSVAARPWVTKVDLATLLSDIATNGYSVGAVHLTTAFVTGGLFSLDGVHPNDTGHAIIANAMVDAVNAKFGAAVPHANVNDYMTTTASRARPATDERMLNGMRVDGLETGLRAIGLLPVR